MVEEANGSGNVSTANNNEDDYESEYKRIMAEHDKATKESMQQIAAQLTRNEEVKINLVSEVHSTLNQDLKKI